MKRWGPLIAILLLGAAVRLYGLGGQSLSGDEAFSANYSQSPLSQIASVHRPEGFPEVHPPLYYLFLHMWIRVFPLRDIWVRVFSSVLGIATLGVTYALARTVTSGTGALWATAFLAFSSFHVWYSQDTRMYALLTMFTTLTLLFVFKGMAPSESRIPNPESRSTRWLLASLCLLAALYTHYIAFLLWGWCLLYATLLAGKLPRFRLAVGLIAGGFLLYLPWLPALQRDMRFLSEHPGLGGRAGLGALLGVFAKLFAGGVQAFFTDYKIPCASLVMIGTALMIAGLKGLWERHGRQMALFWLGLLGLPVLGWVISFLTGAVFRSYTFVFLCPIVALLMGLGVEYQGKQKGKVLGGVMVLGGLWSLTAFNFSGNYANPHARAIVREVEDLGCGRLYKIPEVLPGVGAFSFLPYAFYAKTVEVRRAEGPSLEVIAQIILSQEEDSENFSIVLPGEKPEALKTMGALVELLGPDFGPREIHVSLSQIPENTLLLMCFQKELTGKRQKNAGPS